MAVNDVLTLRVVGRYQSQNIVNTLHYRVTAQTSDEKEINSDLLSQWATSLETPWVTRHSSNYDLVGLKAFRKTGVFKTPAFSSRGTAGLVSGTDLPAFVCRTITLYTDSAKIRRRGRIMLSGSVAAMFDTADGSATSSEIVGLNVLAAALIAPLESGGNSWQLCIPPAGADPYEDIIDTASRETPSSVTTRRIRQFFVG